MSSPAISIPSRGAPGRPGTDWRWGALLFLGALALYAAGTSFTFATGAGELEIALAQQREWFFRPQHLLGTALLRLYLALGARLGLGAHAVASAHLINIVLGAAAVALLFGLLRALSVARVRALLAAVVLAASNALWHHTTSGEAVVMALPFALAALALVADATRDSASTPAPGWRQLLASALFWLAVLLSVRMLLLLPALLALVARQAPVGQRGVTLARAGALALLLGLGPFVTVAALQGHASPGEFFSWLFARNDGQALAAVTGGPLQLPRAVAGIGRLIFASSEGESAVRALLTGERVAMTEGLTLVRNLLAAAMLLALALRGARRLRGTGLLLPLLAPLGLAASLGLWWLSSDPELWLPVFPLLLALAAFGLADIEVGLDLGVTSVRRGAAAVALAAGLLLSLGAANRCREAPSALCRGGGPEWRAAARLAAVTSDADLVMGPTGSELLWLPHFRPRTRVLHLDHGIPQDVDAADYLGEIWSAVEDAFARGGRVFIQGLTDPAPARLTGAWVSIESKHGVSRSQLVRLLEHEFRRRAAPEVGPAVEELLPRRMAGVNGPSRPPPL